jgi:3-oxoacyl-[acyl-carrier protein] reductase
MNVLITGISKGLGFLMAQNFLKNGMTVYGISRSKSRELECLLQEFPDSLKWISADISTADDAFIRQNIFKDWIGKNTPIEAFINNAAVAYDDIISNIDEKQLIKMFQTNVIAPMLFTKFTIRNMLLHRTAGSIIHISSISAHTGYKGLSMYASTKGALEAFSKNTAREWGSLGIRSNCIVAGFMETEMSSTLSSEQKNRIFNRTSLKKPVSIDSIAETVNFLINKGAESITGQNIFIDNGTI